uniref:uncharacterized protein n=1 Tax=Pristiophorus japonicus TaxID=55135 RepID=UPI00398F516B
MADREIETLTETHGGGGRPSTLLEDSRCCSQVTTDDNHQWLIHKGHGYGRSSQTVVVDAAHMSAQWREMPERPVERRTLGDFVRAGGENYGLFRNNCHHAATSMMNMID